MLVFYAITDIIGILSFCSVKVLGLYFILFAIETIDSTSRRNGDNILELQIYGLAASLLIYGSYLLLFAHD